MKIGDIVLTPDGPGKVVAFENFRTPRVGVKLKKNKYWFTVAYYFKEEICN